jgi:hypothetical protein
MDFLQSWVRADFVAVCWTAQSADRLSAISGERIGARL